MSPEIKLQQNKENLETARTFVYQKAQILYIIFIFYHCKIVMTVLSAAMLAHIQININLYIFHYTHNHSFRFKKSVFLVSDCIKWEKLEYKPLTNSNNPMKLQSLTISNSHEGLLS